ncbi:MAG TPA: hypothetical protein VHD84_03415 [Candidatus Saccharimonadales bacterium]|nr:hypothetical protein [Candidatus Saccharimonadales bacterium]
MPQKYSLNNKSSRRRGFRKSRIAKLLAAVVLVAVVIAILEITNVTHFFHKSTPATEIIKKVGSTNPASTAPPANISANNPTGTKTNSSGGSLVQGGATDTKGQAQSTTNPSQWIKSTSGNITVKQPLANSTLQSGDSLIGSAKVGTVYYRLIDDKLGVVASGSLDVSGGDFSGTLHFGHKSSTGRLDVYSTNSQGVELNEIQIGVKF